MLQQPDAVQDNDEQLIDGIVRGQIAALDALYSRYSRPVYSLALRMLRDTRDAEEVTQDVFERVWRHAGSFNHERGKVGTWLLSMTHHVAVDVVRKQQRRPQVAEPADDERGEPELAAEGEDLADMAIRTLEAAQVRRALRSLPENQRAAIELAYFRGLSHLEIAAALGDPLGTVKTRIRRGMERLRSALEGIGLGGNDDDTR